jgi:hypothetical protein
VSLKISNLSPSLWATNELMIQSASKRFALQTPSDIYSGGTAATSELRYDQVRAEFAEISSVSGESKRESTRSKFYSLLNLVSSKATPEQDKEVTEAFLRVAGAITDPHFFWEMAGDIWMKGGADLQLWLQLFEKPDFERFHVRKRIQLWNRQTDWEDYGQSLYQNWSSDRPIVAYRVFRVEDGKSIRRSNDKEIPDYFEHVEGWGMSYSLSRTYAQHFSALFTNDEIVGKYAESAGIRDPEELIKYLQDNIHTTWRSSHRKQRAYVGKYHINKRDVISLAFMRSEEEIVAKRARLIHYYPVTFSDWMAANALFHYLNRNMGQQQGLRTILHRMPEQRVLHEVKKLNSHFIKTDADHLSTFFWGGMPNQYGNQNVGIPSVLQKMERRVLGKSPYGPELITFV